MLFENFRRGPTGLELLSDRTPSPDGQERQGYEVDYGGHEPSRRDHVLTKKAGHPH
jgi:hypothetical protein